MTNNKKKGNDNSGDDDIIDVEFTTLGGGGGMIPYQQPAFTQSRRNRPRSNLHDGGYFDASHGRRKPLFLVNPAEDNLAGLMALRAWLSALRNHPFMTLGSTFVAVWVVLALLSGGLNFIRADTQFCTGDIWNPIVTGCNIAGTLKGPTAEAAGAAHDVLLGEEEVGQPVESRTVIRAVKVER